MPSLEKEVGKCHSLRKAGGAMLNDPSPQFLFEKRLLNNKVRANVYQKYYRTGINIIIFKDI